MKKNIVNTNLSKTNINIKLNLKYFPVLKNKSELSCFFNQSKIFTLKIFSFLPEENKGTKDSS